MHIECGLQNFSEAQKPAPHSDLGPARPAECPQEPEETNELEGEAEAPLPIHTTAPAHGDSTPQASGGLPGLGLDRLPPDTIDEGKIDLVYKLGK